METVRFSLIAKEDLALGTSTFEVTLADGRVVQLSQIDLGKLLETYPPKSYATVSALPTAPTSGAIARVVSPEDYYYFGASGWTSMSSAGVAQMASKVGNIAVQNITATGTYTKPTGLLFAYVRVIAGGAGGGGVDITTGGGAAAGGGGGGGSAEKWLLATAIGATETATIGAGGAGGSAGNNNGSAGASTSFGTLVVASGGSPGAGTAINARGVGGVGGVGTTGDILYRGFSGGHGLFYLHGDGTNKVAWAGWGGGTLIAGNAYAVDFFSSGGNGTAGTANTGQGGTGAAGVNSGSAYAGGAGASGGIIVVEFKI